MEAEAAVDALSDALTELIPDLEPSRPTNDDVDLVAVIDGRQVQMQIKYSALMDQPRAAQIVAHHRPGPDADLLVLVSDRVVDSAREQLRRAGISWLDLRGHLHLVGPGLRIDADVTSAVKPPGTPRPFGGRVGLAAAIDLLVTGQQRVTVRETARRIGASPSSVSAAVSAFRAVGLVGDQGEVDLTSLFWAAAEAWTPQWIPVTRYPDQDGPLLNPALQLNLEDPAEAGWALGGDLAAAEMGAPIGLPSGAPPDLYLPTRRAHRLAASMLKTTMASARPAARIAVAPVPAACTGRVVGRGGISAQWPMTRPLFVALDLAQDPGRGAEILSGWDPEALGGVRVW